MAMVCVERAIIFEGIKLQRDNVVLTQAIWDMGLFDVAPEMEASKTF